jgi:hypothetical protein
MARGHIQRTRHFAAIPSLWECLALAAIRFIYYAWQLLDRERYDER